MFVQQKHENAVRMSIYFNKRRATTKTMEEQKQYELRSRSRSRSETPLPPSRTVTENEGSEHQYELRSRSRDRSMTPGEVSSSRRSVPRSLPGSTVKTRSQTMDPIPEQKDDTITDLNNMESTTTQTKSSTVEKSTTKVTRKSERRSTRIKKQIFANGQSDVKDDSSDTRSETKDERESTPKRVMTSDYSSEEGDRDDASSRTGSAYEFYKQQGDYWNKFPKTDYTYSQASTCRYEVAPGVMAIPNMSRRSLHAECNHLDGSQHSCQKESLNQESETMEGSEIRRRDLSDPVSQVLPHIRGSTTAGQPVVYKTTHVRQFTTHREYVYNHDSSTDNQINEKYETWASPLRNANNNRYRSRANVDSDTELDDAVSMSNHRYQLRNTQKVSTFSKFTSLISTLFITTFHLVTFNQFKKRDSFSATSQYYRRYEETKWSRLRRKIDTFMQHMYLLLVKVVLLDSWLLSRASNIRERVQGRYAKIRWLVLLPLLLAIGFWIMPYILSAIPLLAKQMYTPVKEETPIIQSLSPEDLKSNEELRNIVNILISRVQHLEAAKTEQSKHLANVTQFLEELKTSDSSLWKHYDEKLLSIEQELENQNYAKEKCHSEEFDFVKQEFHNLKQLYAQLKTCCDEASANTVSEDDIRKQADQVFAGYFGDSFSKEDVVRIFQIMNSKIQQEDIQQATSGGGGGDPGDRSGLGVDEIRRIVQGILKIYDADKTGLVDYALESAGGQIISTRCTQRYNINTRAFKVLGFTLYYESNNPRTVIQGNTVQPGMCWAFQDFPGYLLIKLRSMIYITGFTIEHAARENLPNGEMKSAPKKFNVWGLNNENDMEPVMFGEYEFKDSIEMGSLQYFPVQNKSIAWPYEYVELRIHSNHGQLEYTCLYRFRVHGDLVR